MRRLLLAFSVFTSAIGTGAAATFTVTNINDSGSGSLRQAILDSGSSAGSHTIQFAIPGLGSSHDLRHGRSEQHELSRADRAAVARLHFDQTRPPKNFAARFVTTSHDPGAREARELV